MQVPFLSLRDVTAMHGEEIQAAVKHVVESGWYLQGELRKNGMISNINTYSSRFAIIADDDTLL